MNRWWVLVSLFSGLGPRLLAGQGISLQVAGHFLGDQNRTGYGAGWLTPRLGFLQPSLGATLLTGRDGRRLGAELQVDLFRSPNRAWYGVASAAAGFSDGPAENPWAAWSAGAGYRLLSIGSADLGLEARYHHLGRPDNSLSLGGRLVVPFGGSGPTRPPPATLPPPPSPAEPVAPVPPVSTVVPASVLAVARDSLVQTAVQVMGSPYAWGGTSANGFDCSGLIQYAYARIGLTLPRRSVDQARAGELVPREIAQLQPGDILAFSTREGGPVTHVGLYIGERRFIHSATRGVRISLLSPDDPNGRHWWVRWVGARRVLQD
jgi:NlpC/P60 family